MEKKVRCIDVRTADGKPILSLYLSEQEITLGDSPNASPVQDRPDKERAGQASSQSTNDSSMTDAQKRYLFRLLADQGMEADAAHQRLKNLFGVDSLQQVGKREASGMIEQLLEENERR